MPAGFGRLNAVVAGDRQQQRGVLVHRDVDVAVRCAAAVIADPVPDAEVALDVRGCEQHPALDHLGSHLLRGGGERVRVQGDGIAVGIRIVAERVHGDGPAGPEEDAVVDGDRFLVRFRGRRNAHLHGSGVLQAQSVPDGVGEGVRSRAGGGGGEINVVRSGNRRAHRGGDVDPCEEGGVAVRVDPVERDGDADGGAGDHPGIQVLRHRRSVLFIQRPDVDPDLSRVGLAGAVEDLVDCVHGLRGGAGDKAQRILRGEDAPVGEVDALGQHRVEGQLIAVGMGVIVQHRNVDHVAGPDRHLVRVGLRRQQRLRSLHGQDAHLSGCRGLAVGDRVGDGGLLVQASHVVDAQHVVVQHGHVQRRIRGYVHRLHHEHPAGGVAVIAEDIDQHVAVARQQRHIAHRNGGALRPLGLGIHPDQAAGALRPVGHEVLDVVGPGGLRGEGDGARLIVRGHHGVASGDLRLGQAELPARGIEIVLQRTQLRFLPDDGGEVVEIDHRSQRPGRPHIETDDAGYLLASVGDHDLHLLDALSLADVAEREQAVRAGAHLVAVGGGFGADQEEVIAVRVRPVGQNVLADRFALLHEDFRGAERVRRLVGVGAADVHGHLGCIAAAAAVGDFVAEGGVTCGRVGRHHDLQACAVVDRLDAARGRLLPRHGSRQQIAVRVGVIGQDVQDGGPACPGAIGIVLGNRRPVLTAPVRQRVDRVFARRFLVLLVGFLLRRDDVTPVIDQLHVLQHQPYIAGVDVVEDHHAAVHPEHELRVRPEFGDVLALVIGVVSAVAQVYGCSGPGRVDTAVQLDRRRGNAVGLQRRHHRIPAAQGLLDERGGRGHHGETSGRSALLEAPARSIRERNRFSARKHEAARFAVECHRLVSYGGELHVTEIPELFDLDNLGLLIGTVRGDHVGGDCRRTRIGHEDPVVGGDGRRCAGRPGDHGFGFLVAEGREVLRGSDPHGAAGPVGHRSGGAAHCNGCRSGQLNLSTAHHVRHINRADLRLVRVDIEDRRLVLDDVEAVAVRRVAAVEQPGLVVQVSNHAGVAVGDPDPAVVQVNLCGGKSRVQERTAHHGHTDCGSSGDRQCSSVSGAESSKAVQ